MHPKMVSKPIRAQPNKQKAYNPKQTPNKNLFELIDFVLIVYSVSASLSPPPPQPKKKKKKNQLTINAS